jgi:hypothetical protein
MKSINDGLAEGKPELGGIAAVFRRQSQFAFYLLNRAPSPLLIRWFQIAINIVLFVSKSALYIRIADNHNL